MDWIAVDWGTTNLRAWAMARDSHVPLAEARSAEGMATLEWEDFEPALLRLISPWLGGEPTTVLACGMVGARQGWVQAPYEEAPCPPLTLPFTKAPTRDPRLDVRVVGGISQSGPADVMRGEETQIAGALAHDPAFNGVICLPGTHSKWAAVLGGRIVDFQTFMTGEIFGLLSRQSVLRHGVGTEGWDEEAYAAAVAEMLEAPESLTSRLFGLRASSLLEGMTQETARARLSGMLIGTELANARERWQAGSVALIGEQGLCERYARALRIGGTRVRLLDGTEMTLRGLLCAHDMLTRTE